MATRASGADPLVRATAGVPLLTTDGAGNCVVATGAPPPPPAAFAVDARAACALRFTRAELKAFCQTGEASAWPGKVAQVARHFARTPVGDWFVGAWGNSDVGSVDQWVQVASEDGALRLLIRFLLCACSWACAIALCGLLPAC
jgi:hypothetical protein